MNPLALSADRAGPGGPPDEGGQAVVEFALVGPIFILMVCAIMEFSGIMFAQTLLEGGAREASRYGITGNTIEGVTRDEQILNIIESHAHGVIDMAELEMETLVYDSFENIGEPEPFTDEDGNGHYDEGEPFTDVNGNAQWDDDMGATGLGGPGDVVVYRLAYPWPIMVPLFEPFFGEEVILRANMAVRNEPFPGT